MKKIIKDKNKTYNLLEKLILIIFFIFALFPLQSPGNF